MFKGIYIFSDQELRPIKDFFNPEGRLPVFLIHKTQHIGVGFAFKYKIVRLKELCNSQTLSFIC